MKSFLHATSGTISLVLIASFWISTAVSELFMDHPAVAFVKRSIVHGLFLLVPLFALTALSGMAIGKGRKEGLVARKVRRMRVVAANGLLVLLPAALYLNGKAGGGQFDVSFFSVQVIELIVGIVQMILLGLNLRDGLRLAGKLRSVS